MKKFLLESYKTFYIGLVSILWVCAILFALVQNSFLSGLLLKNTLPYFDVTIKEARGGFFGVISLEGVAYKNIATCDSLNVKFDILTLMNSKKLSLSLLDVKALKLNRQKLSQELNKSAKSTTNYIDSVEIENASIGFLDHKFGDFELNSGLLKLSSFSYDFKRLVFEYSLDAKTNVINAKCAGHFKDYNYTAKGELKASGGKLINEMSKDVDFDFNALKDTSFSLHGDDRTLSAKFDLKNSGIFYKYGVDARIVDVKSELFYDFGKQYVKVSSAGLVTSRYGDVDTVFDVVYDKKTTYSGRGVIKKFNYIPLGIFKDDIRISSPSNCSVSFEGDAHRLTVKAAKTLAKATIKGEAVEVTDSDTLVVFDFDKSHLKVDVKAQAFGRYGSFDVSTTVFEDERNRTSFSGTINIKESKGLPIKDSLLANAKVKFAGDEGKLGVELGSKIGSLVVQTNGYKIYHGKLKSAQLTLSEHFGIESKLGHTSFKINSDGYYDYKKDSFSVGVSFENAKYFDKNINFSRLLVSRVDGKYHVEPFDFSLASLKGRLLMQNEHGERLFILDANGLEAKATMGQGGQSRISAHLDTAQAGSWLEELFNIKRNALSARVDMDALTDSAGKTNITISSPSLSLGALELSPLKLSASYTDSGFVLKDSSFMLRQIPYKLDHSVVFEKHADDVVAKDISFNNKFFIDASYKSGIAKVDYRFKDFDYHDPKLVKLKLDGSGWATLKDDKLFINGELGTRNLELFYSSRGAKITKDKDIKVIKPKRLLVSEDWLLKNCSVNLRIINSGPATLKTKESNALFEPDLVYYKDFGKKGNFVGSVKVISGSYVMEGRQFKIENGEIILLGGDEENPYIDIVLRLDEADISIFVGAKGYMSAPKLNFWSKPALSEREIMSYLIFGIDDGFGFGKSGVKSDYTTKAIGAFSNILSRDIASEFGVKLDKIEVSPGEYQNKDGKVTTGTKVEIGKKITKDLTLIYKNDVESGVALQYRLNKNVGIETESRSKGSSVELFYKQDY